MQNLCTLASDGELDEIRAIQSALSSTEFRRQLFSVDVLMQTPLALATRYGHFEVAEFLLNHGEKERHLSIFILPSDTKNRFVQAQPNPYLFMAHLLRACDAHSLFLVFSLHSVILPISGLKPQQL
jgi:ankyrin repeat protein